MISQEKVLEIYARANPAPTGMERAPAPETAVYLDKLRERSNEMQTIDLEKQPDTGDRPPQWKWIALAAAVIVVIATVGIILTTSNDEAPIATTPQVEEPEPVPSTEPEAVEEPEPTPTTVPEASGPEGIELFDFQTEPGDYYVEHPIQSFLFTSDGEWGSCSFRCADWDDGLAMTSRLVSAGIVAIDPSSSGPEAIRAELESVSGLIVGEWTPVEPQHPDATWTGQALTVDIADDAGTDPQCEATGSGASYPCAFFEFAGFPNFVVLGPTTLYVLESGDGSRMLATPYWGHEPLPTDQDFAALDAHFLQLIQTIRFVD